MHIDYLRHGLHIALHSNAKLTVCNIFYLLTFFMMLLFFVITLVRYLLSIVAMHIDYLRHWIHRALHSNANLTVFV